MRLRGDGRRFLGRGLAVRYQRSAAGDGARAIASVQPAGIARRGGRRVS
ncbi:hypothetical protein ACFQ1L_24580 [Phytohabitans flavus]|nr:hypothetical protein [Phytohabitans flavus]